MADHRRTRWCREKTRRAAKKNLDRAAQGCGGTSNVPATFDGGGAAYIGGSLLGGASGGILLEEGDVKKEKGYDQQKIGNAGAINDGTDIVHGTSSQTLSATTKDTIPNKRFFINQIQSDGALKPVMPGTMSIIPNHPAERLPNTPAMTERFAGERSAFITGNHITNDSGQSIRWLSLIRPAFAANGQAGGGGCAARQVIDALAGAAKKLVQPPAVTIGRTVGRGQIKDETLITPLESAAKNFVNGAAEGCNGGPAAFGGSLLADGGVPFTLPVLSLSEGSLVEGFGAGGSHEENDDGKQHKENTKQQIGNGERIVHTDFPFSANNRLNIHAASVANVPTSITTQFGLSTEVKSGATTPIAKSTLPALSKIFDSRAMWAEVSTGSFQMYNTPNDSIGLNDTTGSAYSSITHSFIRPAYAAETGGVGPSGGGGVSVARV